jgi:hypothetical protein
MEIKPVLSFNFDIELYESEITMKGYCSDVQVTLPDNSNYRVCFYDPVRLGQDLESEGYIGEPGLIVINEVTIISMEKAVFQLWLDGFFDKFKPTNG